MSTTGRFEWGQILTTGEKAFLVMLAAGLFGYWAGFNLSAPGATLGMPVAAAVASAPVAHQRAPEAAKVADADNGTQAPTR